MPISKDPLLRFIGVVRSPLRLRDEAPRQGDEGAPAAWLEIDEKFGGAVRGLAANDEILVLTWLHQADRDVLEVHPRGDLKRPRIGVFSTRSPDRPNPIGLHRVTVLEIAEDHHLKVRPLEAIEGTPIIDIKPVLLETAER